MQHDACQAKVYSCSPEPRKYFCLSSLRKHASLCNYRHICGLRNAQVSGGKLQVVQSSLTEAHPKKSERGQALVASLTCAPATIVAGQLPLSGLFPWSAKFRYCGGSL